MTYSFRDIRSGQIEVINKSLSSHKFLGMKYFSNIDILYMIRIRIVQGLLILSLILKNIFLLNLTFDLSLRSSFDLKRTRKFEFFFSIIHY